LMGLGSSVFGVDTRTPATFWATIKDRYQAGTE